MKTISLSALALTFATAAAAQTGPEGYWVTVDDETNAPRGIVELAIDGNGELVGTIRGTLVNEAGSSTTCDDCEGDMAGAPIIGLPFLRGLERDNDSGTKWKSGRITDPENGKTYKSKAEFEDDFSEIKVRGYVGSPILGRNQYWRRATPEDIAAANAIAELRDLPRIPGSDS